MFRSGSFFIIFQVIAVTFFLFGCVDANGERWLGVPNGKYILISKRLADQNDFEYAAVKLTQQTSNSEDLIIYEWITLNPGELIVFVENQNFKAGTKKTVGRFGIGFEGYRFCWQPSGGVFPGRIRSIYHGIEGVRYCLSDYTEVRGRNLHKEIDYLEEMDQCR